MNISKRSYITGFALFLPLFAAVSLQAQDRLPAYIELDTNWLDGVQGVVLQGSFENAAQGIVGAAGDVNGDGYNDFLIGSAYAGHTYLVYGKADGFPSAISLSTAWFNGTNGVMLDAMGYSVSKAGDVNDDGYADFLVGVPFLNVGEIEGAGEVFLVYGGANLPATISLTNALWPASGEGVRFSGILWGGYVGASLSSVGDFNGDGRPDFIIGAPQAYAPDEYRGGAAYLVFGRPDLPQTVLLTNTWLNGTNGVFLVAANPNDSCGSSVWGAGDVNADGFNEILIGAPDADPNGVDSAGETYLVYGRSGLPAMVKLTNTWLDGANGVLLKGVEYQADSGCAVGAAGDVNGDGLADLLIGARLAQHGAVGYYGDAFLVYGKTNLPSEVLLTNAWLNGVNGVYIPGHSANIVHGTALGGVGDVNLDGYDDFMVGAPQANEAYLMYGGANLPATLSMTTNWLDGTNGVFLSGNNLCGNSIAGLGDVNGDGIPDLLVGAPSAWIQGNNSAGETYLIFGRAPVAMSVLGTNGAIIASGEAAGVAKGTAFGAVSSGATVTNLFSITNGSTSLLTLSGATTNGPGASSFRVVGLPATVAAGAKATFRLAFNPPAGGSYIAAVHIANNSATTPYIVNLTGAGTGGQNQTIAFPAIPDQRPNSKVGLAATASSGLPVSFSVGRGPAVITDSTNLSFTATGSVFIVASQAGNGSWNPAPSVTNSFSVLPFAEFSLRAMALTNSVVLRWTDPYAVGFSNQTVMLRFSAVSYPADTNSGTAIYVGANQVYTHANLVSTQLYYYTIWCSHDGTTFVPPPYDGPPTTTNGPVTVFWLSTLGETAYWHLDTNGILAESGTVRDTPVDPQAWTLGGFADINKDRRPELFWCPTNATMRTWFLDANYQYSSNAILYGSQCPWEYQFRCAGDASGDGFDDLFFEDVLFGYIDTWHVNPNGTLRIAQPTYASSINRSLQLRACGDVNGDGRVELFFHNTNSDATEVWFMDTNGQQTAMLPMNTNAVPHGWDMRCAGDVSGDGLAEVFWQHTNGSTMVWFLNTNGYVAAQRAIYSSQVDAGWRMVGTADVNEDGRVELLWHHSDGSTRVWFMNTNGTFARLTRPSASPMDPKWRMIGGFTAPPVFAGQDDGPFAKPSD